MNEGILAFIIFFSFWGTLLWCGAGLRAIKHWPFPETFRQFAICAVLCGPIGIPFWGVLWVIERLKSLYHANL